MYLKKIALVICYFQANYGSQLQAFATQKIFNKLNIENETIRIDGLLPEINRAKYRYFFCRILDIDTVRDKWGTIRKCIAKRIHMKYSVDSAVRDKMFNSFSHSMFNLSPIYNSKAELSEKANQYAMFVVGSDQLWLPSNIAADYYTLNFVPKKIPRMSLSTSFGVSSLPPCQAKKAISFLSRINYLSVREESGKKLIKKLTDLEAPVVCDPTLLFAAEEWDSFFEKKKIVKGEYILCYFLGNNPIQRDFADKLRQYTGLKIVQLAHLDEYIKSDIGFADETPYDVGPAEFIGLIRDANYVLTDSFHCTIFSIIYKKVFFSFRRYNNDSAVSTNSRLYFLLSSIGLKERLLDASEGIEQCLSQPIDYNAVHHRIESSREFTMNFIHTALRVVR